MGNEAPATPWLTPTDSGAEELPQEERSEPFGIRHGLGGTGAQREVASTKNPATTNSLLDGGVLSVGSTELPLSRPFGQGPPYCRQRRMPGTEYHVQFCAPRFTVWQAPHRLHLEQSRTSTSSEIARKANTANAMTSKPRP